MITTMPACGHVERLEHKPCRKRRDGQRDELDQSPAKLALTRSVLFIDAARWSHSSRTKSPARTTAAEITAPVTHAD